MRVIAASRTWMVALAVLAAACAADGAGDASSDGGPPPAAQSEGGWIDERSGGPVTSEGLYAGARDAALAPGAAAEGGPVPPDELRPVTAGSVDDNELWDEYLLYRQEFLAKGIPVSDIDVSGRQLLTVIDASGDPVLGARITVRDQEGSVVARLQTYADGRAVFHRSTDVDPSSQSRPRYTAVVEKSDVSAEVELDPDALAQTLQLDAELESPANLDVLFLIDTTGSMSDEIERLKANMISVAEQISEMPSRPDVRFSMVVYRDRGDEYVTRTFEFTHDIGEFTAALGGVVADAGGDAPESLGAGLHDALANPAWREDDAVKLIFLLADAPAHLRGEPGYEDEPDYAEDLVEAAAAGVKIFPIASSGLDEQGEFMFRQLAQVTMGRFVFLTYGADGRSPGTSTPHDVDPEDYDVLALDALVVELVAGELSYLSEGG